MHCSGMQAAAALLLVSTHTCRLCIDLGTQLGCTCRVGSEVVQDELQGAKTVSSTAC